jgi:hypothetical protein
MKSLFNKRLLAIGLGMLLAAILLAPAGASAGSGGVGTGPPTVAGPKAKLRNGEAIAPAGAPAAVKRAIAAGNAIRHKPYRLGGGHAKWKDTAYDCSGSASYVLGKYGARKLDAPMPSGSFEKGWGVKGHGKWITTYANGGHMYVVVAGLRFDTSNNGYRKSGPRWTTDLAGGKVNGPFKARHPSGL